MWQRSYRAIFFSCGYPSVDMPICAATRRRFHHRLRAVWRDRWRASRLRFLLQAGNVARATSILRVWEGGMSSHGGMFGLLLFTFYYAQRHKISWLTSATILSSPRRLDCSSDDARTSSMASCMGGSRMFPGQCNSRRNCSIIRRKLNAQSKPARESILVDHAGCDHRRGARPARCRKCVALDSVAATSVATL